MKLQRQDRLDTQAEILDSRTQIEILTTSLIMVISFHAINRLCSSCNQGNRRRTNWRGERQLRRQDRLGNITLFALIVLV
jgi:hypothetical protein